LFKEKKGKQYLEKTQNELQDLKTFFTLHKIQRHLKTFETQFQIQRLVRNLKTAMNPERAT
jgi:hypothetical protein